MAEDRCRRKINMWYKTEKIVGKMSLQKLHETILELERKYTHIIIVMDVLNVMTQEWQVTIEYR